MAGDPKTSVSWENALKRERTRPSYKYHVKSPKYVSRNSQNVFQVSRFPP